MLFTALRNFLEENRRSAFSISTGLTSIKQHVQFGIEPGRTRSTNFRRDAKSKSPSFDAEGVWPQILTIPYVWPLPQPAGVKLQGWQPQAPPRVGPEREAWKSPWALNRKTIKLHGKRLTERRQLFQPSQVHFDWFFPVFCVSASFFDPWKSCDELLCFVKMYVSDVQVVVFSSFEDLGQIFIYICWCRGPRPHSVQPLLYQHIDFWVKLLS